MSDASPLPHEQPTLRGMMTGQRYFGRFLLIRPLGRGGMGIVWLARDELLDEEIALKFLPDLIRWDPAAIAELKEETRRARQLTHPNIVRIHDLFEDSTGAAIAMEFIDGRTLTEERLARPSCVIEPAEIRGWLPQLVAALDYAHRDARVVHRDLKPSNVMLTRDGRVKVTDFGVARALGETMLRVSQLATGGTLLYMSPQQALGEPPTPRDDIYALGATLYELLTGRPPFHTGNVAAQLERRKPDSIAERRRQLGITGGAEVPLNWEQAIAACLAKQPEERPASAGAFAALLIQPTNSLAPSRLPWFLPKLRPRTVWLSVTAALLALSVWALRPTAVRGLDTAAARAPVVFASDATRAYAAWNFDGDGRDASGRGWDLQIGEAEAVPDRFGRIDRALALNGASSAQVELPSAVGWSAREPFSLSLWARPSNAGGLKGHGDVLVSMRSEAQDDLYWSVGSETSALSFYLGRLQVDQPDKIVSPQALVPGRWTHVAVVSDGREVRLYRDGREEARGPIERHRDARITAPPTLAVGYSHKFDLRRFAGAVDDLRLWRRALGSEEVARLASPEPPPRFAMTAGVYAETEDLAAAVAREFGPTASIADWRDLKRWHADDVVAWCEELALPRQSGGPLLQNNGQRFSEATRHYFLNRFDGKKPDYYRVHEELGGMRLALGSWHGFTGLVLVRQPHQAPQVEIVRASGADHASRELAVPSIGAAPTALALEWVQEMSASAPIPTEVELLLRDGRTLIAICSPQSTGAFALALGAADRPELSRKVPGTFGSLRFTLVLRQAKLKFGAVRQVGGGICFQEELEKVVSAREVARVTVRGVDSFQLTTQF